VFKKPYTYAPLRAEDKAPMWGRKNIAGSSPEADVPGGHASVSLCRGGLEPFGAAPGEDLAMSKPTTVTAAVLLIGDEILSGRTKDRNLGYIAEYLAKIGVDVREARVVPDVEDDIVAAINALRARYDYVVTTGGIGPTHDDITADAVARAFGVTIGEDPRIIAAMLQRYAPGDLTPARRRMARIPATAELIENPVSMAPGFRVGNVYVMAGVPAVMQAMLDFAVKTMKTGAAMQVETVEAGGVPEGRYGDPLGAIAAAHPDVTIGSYPSYRDGRFNNQIVVRGKGEGAVAAAKAAVEAMVAALSGDVAAR
jgi:molybdenum cofactor synthesis domain-containing protein